MDERVKEVQVWLNKTYKGVNGFEKAPENGRTGWATIYSLREALQHELGISTLGQGFGDMTKSALKNKIGSLVEGYSGNIVKLIKGAFWCKGISPTDFTSKFNDNLTSAIKELQNDAGVTVSGKLTVNLMAALFDMSAFVLIEGQGKSGVRSMQRYLNGKYSDELGILPCDGIYQRATNTALIFALQKAIGIAGANGNYGPGTIAATPTVSQGANGEVVRIIQYGLYVNGFYDGSCDGNYTSEVSNAVVALRKFMNLPPFTGTSDLTVIKGLLTSNGNTNRDSIALDTSTQLTSKDVTNFKNYGFSIVGRYLTGSVGAGASKRDKYLTAAEIKRITDAGLAIYPIYEDGGYEIEYFSRIQGYRDGIKAVNQASKLGFPAGATIYFAVDVDIQDGDIDGTVVPYMEGVVSALASSRYNPGIYGTRNVCLHGEKVGMKYSFVADMSYGWSGNLGFKMPKNWAFDQFVEYPIGGTPIDQVAASGKDSGTKYFSPGTENTISVSDALDNIRKNLGNKFAVDLNKTITISNGPALKVTLTATDSFSEVGSSPVFTISNGKLNSANITNWLANTYGLKPEKLGIVVNGAGTLVESSKITAGNISVKVSANSNDEYKLSFICNVIKEEDKLLDNELSLIIDMTIKPLPFLNGIPNLNVNLSAENAGRTVVLIGIAALALVIMGNPELLPVAIAAI